MQNQLHRQVIEYPAAWLDRIDALAEHELRPSRKSMIAALIYEGLVAREKRARRQLKEADQ